MANQQEYKCPCCGGAIAFDSTIQKLKCPYCDSEFDVETLQGYDEDLKNDAPDEASWNSNAGSEWSDGETLNVFVCQSCGGELAADENTAATACPYCGNPVVLMGRLSGSLKPDLVIPFKLDKDAAKQAFLAHLQKKRLLPKVFKDQNHIDEIKGLYVPFWLFDAKADANIRYRATRVRSWADSNYNYTETSFYSVIRGGNLAFQAVPVDGSSKMAADLMESVEPFDLKDAVDFQTAYLAGYLADKYDVDEAHSKDRAQSRMKSSTEQNFAQTVKGYATVNAEASSIRLSDGKAKYALYPVWILNTTWNNQQFTFAMNGQTGKFVGNLPVDKNALTRWLVGIAAAGTAALTLLQYLFWLL